MAEHFQPNPLLLDHIVDRVFSFMDLKNEDYLNLRFVCWEWNRVASARYNLKLELHEAADIQRVGQLIQLMWNPRGNLPPLRRLWLTPNFFPRTGASENFQRTFGVFLSLLAPQLDQLRIEMDEYTDLKFHEPFFNLKFTFSRLKLLSLTLHDGFKPYSEFLELLKDGKSLFFLRLGQLVLRGADAVESLSLNWYPVYHWLYASYFANLILVNVPSSVKELELNGVFTEQDAEVFHSLRLPKLLSLTLDLVSSKVSQTAFHQLFHKKNEILRKLSVRVIGDNPGFQLPVFPQLTTLELLLGHRTMPAPNAQLSFTTLFPKVRNFRFNCKATEELFEALFGLVGGKQSKVTTLHWPYLLNLTARRMNDLTHKFQFECLQKLVMTRVTWLTWNIRIIFQRCVQLQELFLEFEVYPDDDMEMDNHSESILMGIPVPVLLDLRLAPPDWRKRNLADLKRHPGISDLKHLKFLSMWTLRPNTVNFTDVTGQFGYLCLPNLVTLVTDRFQMSDEFIDLLKKKFGEKTVLSHIGYEYDVNDH